MEFCGMKREIDRKCLNHARVHANAQSFDRCECAVWMRNAILGNDLKVAPYQRLSYNPQCIWFSPQNFA